MGTLAVAGMPSKLTEGAAISGATPALVLELWTAPSPAKAPPAAAGPRSGRLSAPAVRLAVGACLATARMGGDTSKPAAVATLAAGLAATAAGADAPWAVPVRVDTIRLVMTSSRVSRVTCRILDGNATVRSLPWPEPDGGRRRPTGCVIRVPYHYGISLIINPAFTFLTI
jgi:hypothetical protein